MGLELVRLNLDLIRLFQRDVDYIPPIVPVKRGNIGYRLQV